MPNQHFSRGPKKPHFTSRPQRGGRRPGGSRGPQKKYIHPSKFINHNVREAREEVYQPQHTFADFGFSAGLTANLEYIGYKLPSAIQDKAIPPVLADRDVIGLANTGTGKTAAFLLPVIEHLIKQPEQRNAVLIIAPTRELAQQIDAECRKFDARLRIYSTLIVGGVNQRPQVRDLARNPHIIIGTPGRLIDLLEQKQLHLDQVTTLVLDEADRMCDMGFLPGIKRLASETARKRQTMMFSATMTPAVEMIAREFMHDPETISVRKTATNEHVFQDVVEFDDDNHRKVLLSTMLSQQEFEKVVVFGDTKYGVQRLADLLGKQGVPSTAIHGNKSQGQRSRALQDFKSGKVKVLVATDVAARGLDIPNVSHVINFDTPSTYDDYVHRIGRTGRGGKTGTALTFIPKTTRR